MMSDAGSVVARLRDRPPGTVSMQLQMEMQHRDKSTSVVSQDVELQVGKDRVWLVARPTASVMTPMGKRNVEYSATMSQIPIESCTFGTRFKGPEASGDLVARLSIAGIGHIERPIGRDEIPDGTADQCLEGYRTLLRDGFFTHGSVSLAPTGTGLAAAGFSTSRNAQRHLMAQSTRDLSEQESARLEGDLHMVGTAGNGWRLPTQEARTAAMLLSVMKSNVDLAEEAAPSTSQTNALLGTFNDQYKIHAKSRTGERVNPATRFTAALADTANSLYQQPMTVYQRQTSLDGYSDLCQQALNTSAKSPADPGDLYGQLQRIYQSKVPEPSTELPTNKHPRQLKGEWQWNYRDSGDKMLDGVSMEGEDFGKWPGRVDHDSRISLQPTNSKDDTSWLELTGKSRGPWHNPNSPKLTRKERRARKRQAQTVASTEICGVESPHWLRLT